VEATINLTSYKLLWCMEYGCYICNKI